MDLRQTLEQMHAALDEFSRGDPLPFMAMVSHGDDTVLANPFGPAVRGWKQVSEALVYAASRFRDGKVTNFRTLAEYEAPELVTIFELEQWQATVGETRGVPPWDLRVTTTFRPEEGAWKIVHRHADPIAAPDPNGPLRASAGRATP